MHYIVASGMRSATQEQVSNNPADESEDISTSLVDENFQLDARAGVGLGNDVAGPDYLLGYGLLRRF